MRVDHRKKTNYQVRDNIATYGHALLTVRHYRSQKMEPISVRLTPSSFTCLTAADFNFSVIKAIPVLMARHKCSVEIL